MKAFLLAAGHGQRLRPLTDARPKCLLPVAGIPMLDLWLDHLREHGVDEVLVNLHAHASQVQQHLAARHGLPRVRAVEEPTLLGSAGTLRHNRDWIAGEESFWICYADVLTDCDLGAIARQHRKHRFVATLGLYEVPDPSRCGIARVEDEVIVGFEEKPRVPSSNLAFTGVMLLRPEAVGLIPDKIPADIGFDLLPQLAGQMTYVTMHDFFLDIGNHHNYQLAQSAWRTRRRVPAPEGGQA